VTPGARRVIVVLRRPRGVRKDGSAMTTAAPPRTRRSRVHVPSAVIDACRDGAIVPWFQPRRLVTTGAIESLEALARWRCEERWENPATFARTVGRTRHTVEFDLTMLGRAWQAARAAVVVAPGRRIAVNVSPATISGPHVVGQIERLLAGIGMPPERLEIEITELRTRQPDPVSLAALRRLGVRIALDDFGTGSSGIRRLLTSPVDVVKLDRSLLVPRTSHAEVVLDGIVRLAHDVGAAVVAEGVETPVELARVAALGCDVYQGWFGGRPAPIGELDLAA